MIYETGKYAFNFQQVEIIRSFGYTTFSSKVALGGTDKKQSNLYLEFNNRARPRAKADKKKKWYFGMFKCSF